MYKSLWQANVSLVWDETHRVLYDWFTHIELLQKSTKDALPVVDLVADMEQVFLFSHLTIATNSPLFARQHFK
jgi:hypothetical protein